MRSTFHGFSTALSGLKINQKALDVTGQNISNMGTTGYTRQRLDLYSLTIPTYSDMYANPSSKAVGQGVDVTNVAQIRDPFLDVRFRREAAQTGELDANLTVLKDLEGLFDETQKEALGAQFKDLKTQLQNLASHTGFTEFDNIVKSSAESLTNLLNQYANQLTSFREQEEYNFEKVSVSNVNDILKSIKELNKSIKKSEIFGSPSLELMDQRNVLLDELSTYMNINVTYTPIEVAKGTFVNELSIDIMGANGATRILKDDEIAEFSCKKDANGQMILNVTNTFNKDKVAPPDVPDPEIKLNDELTTGIFKGELDALNKSGEFDNPASTSKGIGYYEKRLDLLASKFAEIMNKANEFPNPNYDPNDTTKGPQFLDHPLFGTNDGTTNITAKNICIASGWKNNEYMITASKDTSLSDTDISGKNDNIMDMIAMFDEDFNFEIAAGAGNINIFKGTFQEYFGDCNNVLALDVKSKTSALENHQSLLQGVSDARDSVSGVSLDEEGINLLQFQKAYSASARFMTTLDQALDTLINRTGTVGL